MVLGFAGSASFQSRQSTFDSETTTILGNGPGMPSSVISAGADGTDAMAQAWANSNGISYTCMEMSAGVYNEAADYIRRKKLLEQVDTLIVFWDEVSGRARALIDQAETAGVDVWISYIADQPPVDHNDLINTHNLTTDIDHGSISGLSGDDHPQYHNNTRGDLRYYTQSQLNNGQLDNRYFTETEHLDSSAGAGDAGKPVKLDSEGHIDSTMVDSSDIDHDQLINTHGLTNDITLSGDASGDAVTEHAVKSYVDNNSRTWITISPDSYTSTPASASTITMSEDLSSYISAGESLEYTMSGQVYYGQVSSITSNLLTVRGVSLDEDIEELRYGGGSITQLFLPVNGYYEDATEYDLLRDDNRAPITWEKPTSYAVFFKAYSRIHDSGSHGYVNVRIHGSYLIQTGLEIAANATWYSTSVEINTEYYETDMGNLIEVSATKGGNGDAMDLVVEVIFITP